MTKTMLHFIGKLFIRTPRCCSKRFYQMDQALAIESRPEKNSKDYQVIDSFLLINFYQSN